MQKEIYLIKEAAKAVQVESHVLRYWEEELEMPIQRNEKGHRIYTQEDVDRFKKVKELKEEGLQLKAVKKMLEESGMKCVSFKVRSIEDYVKMNAPDKVSQIVKTKKEEKEEEKELEENETEEQQTGGGCYIEEGKEEDHSQVLDQLWNTNINKVKDNEIQFIPRMKLSTQNRKELAEKEENINTDMLLSQEQKMIRMQALIKKFITDTVEETHEVMKESIKQDIQENIAKELDYQFRCREENEEQKEKDRLEKEDQRIQAIQEQAEKWELERQKREEAHYKNIDELLRKSLKSKRIYIKTKNDDTDQKSEVREKEDKKNGEKGIHEKLFGGKRKKLPNN